MPRAPLPSPLVTVLFVPILALGPARAAAEPAVSAADTGLFAPVAAQMAARRAAAGRAGPPAERVVRLIEAGRPDDAARLARSLGGAPDMIVARARAALAVQDFEAMAVIAPALAALPGPDARGAIYAWEAAREGSAAIDSLTRARMGAGDAAALPELLAAGRLAYELLDYARADSLFARALAAAPAADDAMTRRTRSAAHTGRALVMQKRRAWDASLAELERAAGEHVTADVLQALAQTLIRLGRTDEAIHATEWGVRFEPYHDGCHYLLGNGYARRNYTQLAAAYPAAFADSAGRAALAAADALHAAGRSDAARAAYQRIAAAHPGRVDARIRIASLDFEQGRFAAARDTCFAALAICPEYGRAHAILAKALESQRFEIDVHRPEYERRFAATPMPEVPGIERFVANWDALTPRHRKRVALSIAPWQAYIPVLAAGGATYTIKPMYMLLGEVPNVETLRDQRIDYDSRLWDDVRGCGGYHTVTGIEDVERTVFDRYDTVVHELSHQVHGILPADDVRTIQELYRETKTRDEAQPDAFLSRYAGGSVWEYFAEGVNAFVSPRRDAYDPRDIVRERLAQMDPALMALVERFLARTDVAASYPVAYAAGGDDRVSRGRVDQGLPFYEKALALAPAEETVLVAFANALELGGRAAGAESVAVRAVAAHPASGPARLALASARWHAGRGLAAARAELSAARGAVRAEDRHLIDAALGGYALHAGDAAAALAVFDSVLAYQSDNPEGLRGRAAALALAGRNDEAFAAYDAAVRLRTGVVDLRCDFAMDLLRAGRVADARRHLDEAKLLDDAYPPAEALRGWAALLDGDAAGARAHAARALEWGEWCDLARLVAGRIALAGGDRDAAERAWAPVRARIAAQAPPGYVYRPQRASWEHVHTLPAVERLLLEP